MRRVKVKKEVGAGISLLLSKAPREPPDLTSLYDAR